MSEKLVSIIEASKLVGVSRRTIYNWIMRGRLRYVRTASGSVRIFEPSLWRGKDEKVQKRKKDVKNDKFIPTGDESERHDQ